MTFTPGVVVARRYKLGQKLGEGGMGVVWSATHTTTGKPFAIKCLKEPASAELIARFMREARAVSVVRHPNIIEIHNILMLEGGPAIVMDLLEGESLASRLERIGALAWDELASIMLPVFSAVDAAHAAGIVHRDLKPDNIFLSHIGDGRVEPIVFDFGICKLSPTEGPLAGASTLTDSGIMLGTPAYMAPEQVFAEKDVDARADIWALGVILYECATGVRPLEGDSLGQILMAITSGRITPIERVAPQLPPPLSDLIGRMLTRPRDARPASLREPIETLRRLIQANSRSGRFQPDARLPSSTSIAVSRVPHSASNVMSPVTLSVRHPAAAKPAGRTAARALAWLTSLGFVMGMLVLRHNNLPAAAASLSLPASTPANIAAPERDAPATEAASTGPTPAASAREARPKRAQMSAAVVATFRNFKTGRK